MKRNIFILMVFSALSTLLFQSCSTEPQFPKPRAFPRFDFPEKSYVHFTEGCHFEFDVPAYAVVNADKTRDAMPCWYDINFKEYNGKIHISYHSIKDDKKKLAELTEDARELVFKHTKKATSIDEAIINDPKNNKYGLLYNIDGNAASSVQFYITDSTKHFFRAALYFRSEPNIDSIAPVLKFINEDINVLVNSFRWKN